MPQDLLLLLHAVCSYLSGTSKTYGAAGLIANLVSNLSQAAVFNDWHETFVKMHGGNSKHGMLRCSTRERCQKAINLCQFHADSQQNPCWASAPSVSCILRVQL